MGTGIRIHDLISCVDNAELYVQRPLGSPSQLVEITWNVTRRLRVGNEKTLVAQIPTPKITYNL